MNPSPNVLIAFLSETINRLFLKSPTFYKIWMGISGAFVLIVGVPEALTLANIHLPQLFSDTVQKIVTGASTGMFLMALLSAKPKAVAVDEAGKVVHQTNSEKLPFTAIAEKKSIAKKVADPAIDVPVVPVVAITTTTTIPKA